MSKQVEPHKSKPEEEISTEQGDAEHLEPLREFNENERPVLRIRAQRAIAELKGDIETEKNEAKRKEAAEALEDLERIAECSKDEPMSGITPEALMNEDWLEYDELRFHYSATGSMPTLLAAFVTLVGADIAPGRWILEPLAEAFDEILESRDPELVASKLGLQGKGSGAASPLKNFDRRIERNYVYFDMRTLIEEFGLSRRKAADAVIEKFGLDVSSKTLSNQYEPKVKYRPLVREYLDKYSDGLDGSVVWLTEDARDEFLDSFPDSAKRFLKDIRPPKT